MMRKLGDSTNTHYNWRVIVDCIFLFILSLAVAAIAWSDPVTIDTARVVAQNKIQQHLSLYGGWNGSTDPEVGEGQAIEDQGLTVAYNFQVIPSGHILVAVDDAFSPVLLYSASSTFDPERRSDPNRIESWIIPELHDNTQALVTRRAAASDTLRALAGSEAQVKISKAWKFLAEGQAAVDTEASLDGIQRNLTRSVTVGPLLSTSWGQGYPFNLMTPAGSTCDHTLTGCVATAWAQLMRYWRWPNQGLGSSAYIWDGVVLSADFSAATYDWDSMPDILDNGSTQTQKNAVSLLMYHSGIAAEMDYGCSGSGSSAWADEKLDTYFNYRTNMKWLDRRDYSDSEWFALFKAEFDATPPRPVIFSMFETNGAGHELVADGYQNDGTDLIHLNMGWEGYQDAFYNITTDFDAGGYTWEADSQYIVTNISPNDDPPSVDAGENQTVEEGADVELSGSVADLHGADISEYRWSQTGGATVDLSNSFSPQATFTAPNIGSDTTLVFSFYAELTDGSFASDTVSITITDTDGSTAPSPVTRSDDGGGSSGGCFLMALF